ncbi:MAG: BT4734/BF3469 family protein [Bacteroidales bacterium]|nr:BT4734/BF3469 family protein [Bacteroidales bacterium]
MEQKKVNEGVITSIKGKPYNNILPKDFENKVQKWEMATSTKDFIVVDLEELVSQIISNNSNPFFIEMRKNIKEYYETGDEELEQRYKQMKAQLPLISITCFMYPKRSDNNIIKYTGLIVLDIDDKDNPYLREKYDLVKNIISKDLFTKAAFFSPKGKNYGLKIIVEVKLPQAIKDINLRLKEDISNEERKLLIEKLKDFHKTAYSFVEKYYSTKYELNIDKCATNIQGGTYISGDEKIFYNPNSSCFEIIWSYCSKPKQVMKEYCESNTSSIPSYQLMDNIVDVFFKGIIQSRNCIVFQTAMQAKFFGISQEEVIQYALNRFGASDFDEKEITKCVRSGFKNEYKPYNQYLINKSNNENIA